MSDDTEKRALSFAEVRRQNAPSTVEGWKGWDALSRRLAGKVSGQGSDNIWIGVMLRRAAARHPGCLANFRSNAAWASLIRKQVVQDCDMGEPHHFEYRLDDFLRAGNNSMGSANPWSVMLRSTSTKTEYSIGRTRDLEYDIAFAQESRRKEFQLAEERWANDPTAIRDVSDI